MVLNQFLPDACVTLDKICSRIGEIFGGSDSHVSGCFGHFVLKFWEVRGESS